MCMQAAHVHITQLGRNSLVALTQLAERGQQAEQPEGHSRVLSLGNLLQAAVF